MSRIRSQRPSRRELLRALAAVPALAIVSDTGCTRYRPDDGRLHLTYWEKWERFEGQAMKRVVRAFNESQPDIVVHYVSVGLADRKAMTATAGGDPPDAAGMWDGNLAAFADHGIFTPLDPFLERDGIPDDHWLPVYRGICTHRGRMWAIPTAPWTTALHWNKALFREAGLDPDQPPRTLAEFDVFSEELTRYDRNGNIIQMGSLPQEPGWFHWAWGYWFGGSLVDDEGNITANHPRNIEAYEWIQSYSRKFGVERIQRFASGFGQFATPQNPFFSGKIAMVFQGVWMHNWITQFAPGMQWGAAPWPKTPDGPQEFSTAGSDILAIPTGLPEERREAAWQFIKFVCSQKGMEMLNSGQRKNSPLTEVSDEFIRNHEHPYIDLFIRMARSDTVVGTPQLGVWSQYQTEIAAGVEYMRLLSENPATGKTYTATEILNQLQERISRAHQRHIHSMALRDKAADGGDA
jgi:ABC-type glycerol-3-phosphate transport system substrate-binding protein